MISKEKALEILEIEVKPYLPKGHWGSVKNLILNITEDEPDCMGREFTPGCPKCEAYLLEQQEASDG